MKWSEPQFGRWKQHPQQQQPGYNKTRKEAHIQQQYSRNAIVAKNVVATYVDRFKNVQISRIRWNCRLNAICNL